MNPVWTIPLHGYGGTLGTSMDAPGIAAGARGARRWAQRVSKASPVERKRTGTLGRVKFALRATPRPRSHQDTLKKGTK